MPRQRRTHRKLTHVFPEEFGESLVRFKEASGLPWAEIARLIGANELALWRWRKGVHPTWPHLLALLDLAEGMGLAHTLPIRRVRPR